AYGVTLLLVVGTLLAFAAAALVDSSRGTDDADPPSWILLPNPLAAVADAIEEDRGPVTLSTSSPFDGLIRLIENEPDTDFVIVEEVGPDGVVTQFAIDENGDPVPLDSG